MDASKNNESGRLNKDNGEERLRWSSLTRPSGGEGATVKFNCPPRSHLRDKYRLVNEVEQ